MELRDLQAFVAVVQYGNFTRAAEALYISQPTLSKSIQKLEASLKADLLCRTTRQLQLTDIGGVVYEHAQKILHSVLELERSIQDVRNVKSGKIKFGIPPLIGTLFFPEIARKFHEKYPNITLELVEKGAKLIGELVLSGEVDLAIVVLPVENEQFTILPFFENEFVVYVNAEHPLASRSAVTLPELKNEQFITFTAEFALHDFVIRACQSEGFQPQIAYKSSQWDLIFELIALNLGITILPKAIYAKQTNKNVKIIPFETNQLMWQLGIVTLKDSYQSYALKELLTVIQAEIWSWQKIF
ncbi:LysR family transcriptional regulator [Caldifermentibacillus hisashii]|uniref:LysR family transcriptional regulator n=1 Tax=Caldifermentibacillus hisashii TaxID=996558 RepID=UPI002E1D215D|nr:LysR family transcriptional regulator [Caldifermentibacillus hisashii]